MPTLATALRHLAHWILPVDCAHCGLPLAGDPVPFFCRSCWRTIAPITGPVCPRCGGPFASPITLRYNPDYLCSACRMDRPKYTQAWSLYPYTPPLQDAIRLFKYHGKVALADALGDLMVAAHPTWPVADLLLPVPLHADRLKEREYNQSLLLADRLNRDLRLPLSYDNLIRLRRTAPQTALSRTARRTNLRSAFAVLRPAEVMHRRILLVDDVMTTGATVNECAKALRKAGSADVYVATLARTL